jgi:hypothetical protein
MTSLCDYLTDFPAGSLSIHLGESLPAGVPSLASLVDASFAGYTPSFLTNAVQSQLGNGFSILSGNASFSCQSSGGFAAVCLWVVSTVTGTPLLVAYSPVDPAEVMLPHGGALTLQLSITIFQIPAGF